MHLAVFVGLATVVALALAAPKADLSNMQEIPQEHFKVEGLIKYHKGPGAQGISVELREMSDIMRSPTGTSGMVRGPNDGELILFGKHISTTTTDATGYFTFDAPAAGPYVITAMLNGTRLQEIMKATTTADRARRSAERRTIDTAYTPPPLICKQWVVRHVWDADATCDWVPFLWTPYNNNPVTRLLYYTDPFLCQNGVPGNPSTCDGSYFRYSEGFYPSMPLCNTGDYADGEAVYWIFDHQYSRDYNFAIYAPSGDLYSRRASGSSSASAVYAWRSDGNTVPILVGAVYLDYNVVYTENTSGQFWHAMRIRVLSECSTDLDAGAGDVYLKSNIRCTPHNSTGSDSRLAFEGATSRLCGPDV